MKRGAPLDELPHDRVFRVLDLVDGSHLPHLSLEQHRDARADEVRAAHVVRDDDAGDAELFLHAHHELVDDGGGDRIESGGRLVVEDVLRLARDGARDADPLAHSAGEFDGKRLSRVGKIHELQRFLHARGDFLGREGSDLHEPHRDVFVDRERIEQRGELEDVADVRAERVESHAVSVSALRGRRRRRCPCRARAVRRCA